jgi:hypothetical protein
MCEKYNIKNHVLMFTAYPTETIEDHNETVQFLIDNQKYIINDTIIGINMNSPLVIYKNTPLDRMSSELGIHISDMEYLNVANWVTTQNPELTIKERWRRYLELVKMTVQLRYKRGTMDFVFLDNNIKILEKLSILQKEGTNK